MKIITALLHHIRVTDVVDALNDAGYHNLMLHDVKGTLRPLNESEVTYSIEARLIISEAKLSLVCGEKDIDRVAGIIRENGKIGEGISGWIYVTPIDQSIPID